MSSSLTPEQQRLILQAGLESLVDDALMGYRDFYMGGGSSTHWYTAKGVWIDLAGNYPSQLDGPPSVTWKAVRAHGELFPREQAELRRLRAELVRLQSAVPSWPWGATPEELEAHKKLQRETWAEKDRVHQEMKALVRTMLAAGDPDQPMDLLEAAGVPYETVTAPQRRRAEMATPPTLQPAAVDQGMLF